MSSQFLLDRIAATEASIIALEAAELALGNGTIQSYSLDTGQDRQTVTKLELGPLTRAIASLYNRHATLIARCTGGGVNHARPSW